MSTLPLKAMSRLWGRFNELDIPYYLRVPGFKLYSYIFGVKYVFGPPLFDDSLLTTHIVSMKLPKMTCTCTRISHRSFTASSNRGFDRCIPIHTCFFLRLMAGFCKLDRLMVGILNKSKA